MITRKKLVKEAVSSLDITEEQANKFLDALIHRIVLNCRYAKIVSIPGFGSFVKKFVKGRKTNLVGGVSRKTEDRWVLKFKSSDIADRIVNL